MAKQAGVNMADRRSARRVLTIDQALRWAYRVELPKARPDGSANVGRLANGWDAVTKAGLYGVEIDENPFGVLHDPTSLGAPHPDAVRISAAVDALSGVVSEIADDWHPFRDLGELGEAGEAARIRALDAVSVVAVDGGQRVRQLRAEPRRLVIKYATMLDAPDWQIERPAVAYVCGARGRPKWFRRELRPVEINGREAMREIEVEGYNAKAGRPYPDAYRKQVLDPDPVEAVIWRAEYQVWVAAIELLAIDLEGELETIDVRSSGRMLAPWEEPERLGRVLPDLTAAQREPVTLARGNWARPETVSKKVRGLS